MSKLSALLEYYHASRGQGHTRVLASTICNTESQLLVVVGHQGSINNIMDACIWIMHDKWNKRSLWTKAKDFFQRRKWNLMRVRSDIHKRCVFITPDQLGSSKTKEFHCPIIFDNYGMMELLKGATYQSNFR